MFNSINQSIRRVLASAGAVFARWWGGIGCKLAFVMTAAIFFLSAVVVAFFLWQGKVNQESEFRVRAVALGRYLAATFAPLIDPPNRAALKRAAAPLFSASHDDASDLELTDIRIYNRQGNVLFAHSSGGAENREGSAGRLPAEGEALPKIGLSDVHRGVHVRILDNGVYDIFVPAPAGSGRDAVGAVRLGVSPTRSNQQFVRFAARAAAAVVLVFILGFLLSQAIAASFTKPIKRLNVAIQDLSKQNWKSPVPVDGKDEFSKLASAFNEMAQTLRQREDSLSRGNRDLFLLHTAGLDLMESLDQGELIRKVAARAEDIVKAETIAISTTDPAQRTLAYLGVIGRKAGALTSLEMPVEAGGIYNWLASYGTALLIADAQTDFRLDNTFMRSVNIKSIMTAPLWSSNVMIGILTAFNKRGSDAFDRQDLRLFTVFANLAGAALQNAGLYSDLKQNVDALNMAQQQLVHSTKMAAVGELAANIAHEINNPLTSVLGYATHLHKTLEVPEQSRQKLSMMVQEMLRVRKIIRNLLDFSRQRPSWMQPGDLALPLRETLALMQGVAESHAVTVHESYPAGPITVRMDHNEIKQVFINLITNALQAMPNGGSLSVRLTSRDDQEALVEISDTGKGIAAEHLEKIFEPFFSTKTSGDGTGLGLSISYRIIQNHGGRITVTSAIGGGSTFRVELPLFVQSRPRVVAQNSGGEHAQ